MMKIIPIYVDEAGRWPLAWPMFVGLLLSLKQFSDDDLKMFDDSKKLTEKKREILFSEILKKEEKSELLWEVVSVTSEEIDLYGMTIAEQIAIVRWFFKILSRWWQHFSLPNAIATILTKKSHTLSECNQILSFFEKEKEIIFQLVIDGNRTFWIEKILPTVLLKTIVHGDALVKEIGMASILAKVSRDHLMITLSKQYPLYHFEIHKGYGTKLHKNLIDQYWPCEIHRKLFLKWIFPDHNILKLPPKEY